jgi:hypothetical protein
MKIDHLVGAAGGPLRSRGTEWTSPEALFPWFRVATVGLLGDQCKIKQASGRKGQQD